MATGDRIKIITNTEFEPLDQQINDSTNGLAGKVSTLEAEIGKSKIEYHDNTRSYEVGEPILRAGRIEICTGATSGTYDGSKFQVVNRALGDPIYVEDIGAGVRGDIEVDNGTVTLTADDGTETKTFKFNTTSGRMVLGNPSLLEDSGDNATVVKGDLVDYLERSFENVDIPTTTKVATVDDNGKVNFDVDVNADNLIKLTTFDWDDTNKRSTQVSEPVATASDNKDVLVKKDGDELYQSITVPYHIASVEESIDIGEDIPVTGTNIVDSTGGGMTVSSTDDSITVPKAGIYEIGVVAPIISGTVADDTPFTINFRVNGTTEFRLREYTNSNLSYQHVGYTGLFKLAANDKITFNVDGARVFGSASKYIRLHVKFECDA